jgi:hypothetical protein
MRPFLIAVVLLLIQPVADAAELVREFSGSKSTTTPAFEVDGAWLLDWRLDADYEALVALDITLIDAATGAHVGRVLHTKRKGNGLKLFKKAGRYQLRISTTLGRWRVKIQSITDEEIERYTPRRGPEPVPGLIR